VAAVTGLIYALREVMPVLATGVVYLLPVLLVSTYHGLAAGVATSIASALAFNFFHIPPVGEFTIADEQNWVALFVFVIAAVVTSTFAGLARQRAEEVERRRHEAESAVAELEATAAERDRLEAEAVEAKALRRSDELKTALLRSVSHDLRSPLTAILASAEALGSRAISEEERTELTRAVAGEAARLARMVDQLLDLSKLEAGVADPRRDWCSIDEIAESAIESVSEPPAEGFRYSVDRGLPLLRVDPAQLERALVNVLENAARYADGRHVSVRGRVVGSRLLLRVVDAGPGIPEKERDRIFEAFHSSSQPGERHGSGLGLAIARGFVEANGGRIWAESLPGQGTAIVIEFMLPEQPAGAEVAEVEPSAADPAKADA
jgi:K+-sensing histidine kinase KdpD